MFTCSTSECQRMYICQQPWHSGDFMGEQTSFSCFDNYLPQHMCQYFCKGPTCQWASFVFYCLHRLINCNFNHHLFKKINTEGSWIIKSILMRILLFSHEIATCFKRTTHNPVKPLRSCQFQSKSLVLFKCQMDFSNPVKCN